MPGIFRQPPFPAQLDPSVVAALNPPPSPAVHIPPAADPQNGWWAAFRPAVVPPPAPPTATAAGATPFHPWQPIDITSDPQNLAWANYRRPVDPKQDFESLFITNIPQVILPSAVPSSFSCPAPTVMGGPQRIIPSVVPSSFSCPAPTVVGGANPGVAVYVGGVLFPILAEGASDPIPGAGVATQPQFASQTIGRWTLQFDVQILNNTAIPYVGQKVALFDYGTRQFTGIINEVLSELLTGSDGQIIHHVSAVDFSALLDHRVINVVYPAGSDAGAAVQDIVLNQCAGEGLTVNGLQIPLTPLDTDEQFYFVSASSALDQLATDCACVWWVDQYGNVNFVPIVNLPPCPYSINTESLAGSNPSVRAISVKRTLLDYRNFEYVTSNLQLIPGPSGASSLSVTETYTLPQASAKAAGYALGTLILNFPIGQIVTLTVNGVSQPSYLATSGWNFGPVWWFFPGNNYLYGPNPANNVPAFPSAPVTSPAVNIGDVVAITYVPWAPSGSQTGVTQNAGIAVGTPLTAPGGTFGSGVYQTVDQVKNITSLADLNAIAAAILERSGGVPKFLQFETDMPGAAVGQQIVANVPELDVSPSDSFMITSVQATGWGGNLGYNSAFKYVVIAQTGQDLGNQTKWYERLVARTEQAQPVLQYEYASWALFPGSSVVAGTNLSNPYIVQRSGRLTQVTIAASQAPVGQNLVIDIQCQGTSIFPAGGQPVLTPAGGPVVVTVFAGGPATFIFSQDVLTISATYAATGGPTTQAASVSVQAQWAI